MFVESDTNTLFYAVPMTIGGVSGWAICSDSLTQDWDDGGWVAGTLVKLGIPLTIVMIVAIFGTTISPYLFFWQASQEAEEQRIDVTKQPLIEKHYGARQEFSRFRADPNTPPPVRQEQTLRSDPHFAAAERYRDRFGGRRRSLARRIRHRPGVRGRSCGRGRALPSRHRSRGTRFERASTRRPSRSTRFERASRMRRPRSCSSAFVSSSSVAFTRLVFGTSPSCTRLV